MARPLRNMRAATGLATASLLASTSLAAPCSFSPGVFGDHMVLQRAPAAAMVFGFGTPGDSVTVNLDGVTAPSTTVGADGIWRSALPPTAPGGPHTVGVSCAAGGSAKLQDVLFGDVFFCSGQSNMQFTTIMAFNGTLEAERADKYPDIRVMTVGDGTTSATPLNALATVQQPWTLASNASIGMGQWTAFSAVCWLFGRNVFDALKGEVPIGLISSNWGGTRIAAWSNATTNADCNVTDVPPAPLAGAPVAGGVRAGSGAGPDPNTATVLYNAMVYPFVVGPATLRGITFFQGESDGNTPLSYACQFPGMIRQWKADFIGPRAVNAEPWFGFVILEPWVGGGGPQLRDAQMDGMTVNYTGYGAATDIGDPQSPFVSYHPRAKQVPSARLAAAALAQVYGMPQPWTGPVFKSAAGTTSAGGDMVVTVTVSPGGGSGKLVIKDIPLLSQCPINEGVAPYTCAWPQVQASTGTWVNATLSLSTDGTQLIFTAPAPAPGAVPAAVQYGYGVWPALTVYSDYSVDTGYEVVDFPLLQFNQPVAKAVVAAGDVDTSSVAARQLQPGGCPNGGPSKVVYNTTAAAAWAAAPLTNTSSKSGRPLRLLEPPDGFALSGAGQDPWSFSAYAGFMSSGGPGAANIVPPEVFMTYVNLDSLNTTTGVPGAFTGLASSLACYGDDAGNGIFLIPQLGVAMTDDDGSGTVPPYDGKVAAGEYDYAISQLVVGLRALGGRPVLMRVGYEFNGRWNGPYGADTFVKAWIRIWDAVKADPVLNASVAFVWDYSCDEPDVSWNEYLLPDDKYVDWYGVNPFSKCPPNSNAYPGGCSAPNNATACLLPFIDFARTRGYPVLFAESTPRYVGANASTGAWEEWFAPYLDLIATNSDVVKAFDYIDWQWSRFPQWADWLDARVEIPGAVGPQLRAALNSDGMIHGMPRASVLRALGVQ